MKKTVVFTSVAGAALISSVAAATTYNPALDQSFVLAPVVFGVSGTAGSAAPSQTVAVPANQQPVVGFTVSFDYVQTAGDDSSWASDLVMRITVPGVAGNYVVGNTFATWAPFGAADAIWSFDGTASNGDGHYTSDFFFKATPWPKTGGAWTFDFAQVWDGGSSYNNFTVTLHKIPAPGALALLGVAGLVGSRRRRA